MVPDSTAYEGFPKVLRPAVELLDHVGDNLNKGMVQAGHAVLLFLEALYWLKAFWRKRREIRDKMVVTGFGSLPVVMMVAFFTGLILALQAGIEAAKMHQEGAVGALVSASMFREMGPVMTSIILAALVGSSYAAEIGTMVVSEEIDALRVMSISPVKFLVMPRLIALTITTPILALISDAVGIAGGMFIANIQLRVDPVVFFDWMRWATTLTDMFNGLFKSFVFAIIIAVVGCSQGLQAARGAEGVGQVTMKAVVISFVLILIIDHIINWFLYPMF